MQHPSDGQFAQQVTPVIHLLQGAYFEETWEWPLLGRIPSVDAPAHRRRIIRSPSRRTLRLLRG